MTSTALAIIENQGWDTKLIDYIRDQVLPNVSDEELLFYFTIHKKLGLDPFLKNIWVIKYGGKNQYVTSIKALRSIADRTGKFYPSPKKTEFVYDEHGKLVSATKYICKLTPNGILAEGCSTAMWSSYGKDPKGNDKGSCWKSHPEVMLEKCAEARVLRENFPEQLGELYIQEEFDAGQAEGAIEVQAKVVEENKKLLTSEVGKLGSDELAKLAHKVSDRLIDDPELRCAIVEKDMEEFLADWQNIRPLFPSIDKLLASNRPAILDAFMRWQDKHAA